MYSVQNAYKAMTQFDLDPEEIPLKFDVFPVDNVNNLNQFFFLEYAKVDIAITITLILNN